MAVQNFVVELMEGLLGSKDLSLTEGDIRFYDKGTTAGKDEDLDSFVKWQNARFYNEESNVFRSTTLIVRIAVEGGEDQYVNFSIGPLYRDYRVDGDIKGVLKAVETALKRVMANAAKTVGLLNQFGDLEAIRDQILSRRFTGMTGRRRSWYWSKSEGFLYVKELSKGRAWRVCRVLPDTFQVSKKVLSGNAFFQ